MSNRLLASPFKDQNGVFGSGTIRPRVGDSERNRTGLVGADQGGQAGVEPAMTADRTFPVGSKRATIMSTQLIR
jgi:hypothetical protein